MNAAPQEAPKRVVVGIADLQVTTVAQTSLVTYALGSCVAVMVHDPVHKIGGLIHFMLPLSKAMPNRANDNPALFADTGVPALFRRMYTLGCKKPELVVKVAGGGHLLGADDELDIGRRNVEMVDYLFERSGVQVAARDTGGTESRTIEFHVQTGEVWVRSRGKEKRL